MSEIKEKKKRIDWIDTFKGLAMFFVVWGHCFPTSKGAIKKYIYSFHMPLFFFASGLTFNDKCELSVKDYAKKKFKSLLVPYLILNVIGYGLCYIFSLIGITSSFNPINNLIGIFYSNNNMISIPAGNTWFIATLFLCEMFFYIMRKYIKDDFKLCISVILMGIISYVNYLSEYQIFGPWHIEAAFTAIVFYYLGYLFMKNINIFKKLFDNNREKFLLGGLLGGISIVISHVNRRVSMNGNQYGSIILFYVGSLSAIFAVILFVKLFLNKSKIFKKIGENSMFFLGYNKFVYLVLVFLFPYFDSKNNIKILALTVINCTILYVLSLIIYKYCPILAGKPGDKFYKLISKIKCGKISLLRSEK